MRLSLPAPGRAALALAVLAAAPSAQLDLRSNRVDYRIEAAVEPAVASLAGEEWITWENKSGEATAELWFHLYLNAFSNDRSTHLTESKGRLRRHKIEDGWGWQRVTGVWVARGDEAEVDVLPSFRYRQPDDENTEDRTVFSVETPWPVGSGEVLGIRLTWESRLPRVRRRTGIKGDFLFCAQWFPKLGVYEGGRGWNCHQFHMNTEFYSNYGTYDVTIDLPSAYAGKVGGSGVVVESRVEGERAITRFQAPSADDQGRADVGDRSPLVHDFAWTADPDYVELVETFKFREWAQRYGDEVERVAAALGRSTDQLMGRNVDVRALIQPEREMQAERHVEATMAALFFYGLWWGPYPYEQVTVVDPAWGARAAGGMEYPTIFTAGTRLFTRPSMHSPESVTVHECGHQFWYGLVGNNEFEAAWLDEGLNSYTDSEVLMRHWGRQVSTTDYGHVPIPGVRLTTIGEGEDALKRLAGRDWLLPVVEVEVSPLAMGGLVDFWRDQPLMTLAPQTTDPRWADRRGYLADPDRDPVDSCAFCYVDRRSYRTNSYPRPAVALRTLSGLVGHDAFLRGMRRYAETWRYRHPYPEDFFDAFVEGSGADVHWYFDEVFRGTGTVDWTVAVTRRRAREPRGWFQEDPSSEFVLRESDEEAAETSGADAPEEELEPAPDTEPAAEPEEEAALSPGDSEPGDSEPGDAEPEDAEPGATGDVAAEPDDGASAEGEEPVLVDVTGGLEDGDPGDTGDEKPSWQTEITVSRSGELALPLTVELVFADGARERITWSREEQLAGRWLKLQRVGTNEVTAVRLDPDRDYWLDGDMSDNQWFLESDEVAPLRWSERVFSQVAHYLHWMSAVGG